MKRSTKPEKAATKLAMFNSMRQIRPTIRYVYRDENGHVQTRIREWFRAATVAAINDWMADYYDRIRDGYKPEGFAVPPEPFQARIIHGARVLAEWDLTILDRSKAS